MHLIDVDDLEWLKLNYPGVYFVASKNILQGCLWFRMSYSTSAGKGLINPDEKTDFEDGYLIEDAYALTIEFDKSHSRTRVTEDGGRILRAKNKWKLSLADVHMYKDSSLCLCPEPEERIIFSGGFRLRPFFYNILIPYFYYQSYLEKFGKEPWKGSSHGDLGVLESYDNQKFTEQPLRLVMTFYMESLSSSIRKLIVQNRHINRNLLCACGSTKKYKECHTSAYNGLQKIHADYWIMKSDNQKVE
jgi:hypothetical protein